MTTWRVQVILHRDNGIPADDAINTWHFQSLDATSDGDAATAIMTQLDDFYTTCDFMLASYLATTVDVQIYDLGDDPPRVPKFLDTITVTPSTGDAYPAEVATCLSYRAALASGVNSARRRGRLYLGPLDEDMGQTGSSDTRVNSGAMGTIVDAAGAQIDLGLTADAWWAVYSPTTAGPAPDAGDIADATFRVVACHMDDAFDTVRSRGADPATRSSFVVTLP